MTTAVIADGMNGLYAALTMVRKSDTTPAERADLEKRVASGIWLRIGEAAKVLGVSRSKVDMMMKAGTIGHRLEPGSRYRQANPKDLRKLLDDARQERRGETEARPVES